MTIVDNNDNDLLLEVNYSVSSMIIAETIIILFLGFSILANYKNPGENSWIILSLGIFLFGIFVYVWFKSFKIVIKGGVLKYYQLFGKTKEIPLEEIEEAYIQIGVKDKEDVYKAYIRLIIRPKKSSNIKEFYINIKPFEEKGLIKLFEILPMRKGNNRKKLTVF